MMRRPKPKFVCHLVLKSLDVRREELDHLPALSTDHVIVMLVIVMMLVIGLVVAEAYFTSKSRLGQKLKSTIYGRMADRWVLFLDKPMKVIRGQVLLGTQERFQNYVTLAGTSKA
jgi:hypothetical protein